LCAVARCRNRRIPCFSCLTLEACCSIWSTFPYFVEAHQNNCKKRLRLAFVRPYH
jgi:hypothetical protein